eukprot:4404739-Prymnesium_polylepis.3
MSQSCRAHPSRGAPCGRRMGGGVPSNAQIGSALGAARATAAAGLGACGMCAFTAGRGRWRRGGGARHRLRSTGSPSECLPRPVTILRSSAKGSCRNVWAGNDGWRRWKDGWPHDGRRRRDDGRRAGTDRGARRAPVAAATGVVVAAVRCAGGAHILEPVADRAVLERQPVDTHGHVRLVGALGGVDRVRVRKVVERLAAVARAEEERLGGGPGVGARARADRLRVVRAVHLQIRLVHPLEQQHCAARLGRLRARRERGAVELDGRVDDGGEMGERRVEVAQLQLAPAAPV